MSQTATTQDGSEILIAGDEGEHVPTSTDKAAINDLSQIVGVNRAFFGAESGRIFVTIWKQDIPRDIFDVANSHGLSLVNEQTSLRSVTLVFKS